MHAAKKAKKDAMTEAKMELVPMQFDPTATEVRREELEACIHEVATWPHR